MVQLFRSLRRLTTPGADQIGGPGASDDAQEAAAQEAPTARLPSTVEQLDAAATLIEGLGQLRQISLRQSRPAPKRSPEAPLNANDTVNAAARAPWRRAFALQAWMEEHAQKARRRSSRSLVQRLERALAPLAYPG
jgi:hypothetical protein